MLALLITFSMLTSAFLGDTAFASSLAMVDSGPLVDSGVKDSYYGLQGDFYTIKDQSTFAFDEKKGAYLDENIAFDSMEDIINKRTGQSDWVGANWTGQLIVPETGDYTFYTWSDNGVKLYIDDVTDTDKPKINWWGNQWDVEQSSPKLHLEAGPHAFRLKWFEATGGSHITVRWEGPNIGKQSIPTTAFRLPAHFEGPVVSNLDKSKAQLDKNEGSIGGEITLNGKNLKDAAAQVVTYGGDDLSTPTELSIMNQTDTELTFKVPESLTEGSYKLKLTKGKFVCVTPAGFSIINSKPGVTERAEHPRPDWQRSDWMNLNGWWDFNFDNSNVGQTDEWYKQGNKNFEMKINVPFPWESTLSGITNTSYRGAAWYQREFTLSDEMKKDKKVFLKFGAVDCKSRLYINGEFVGDHNGGYTPFEFDITKYIHEDRSASNTVTLWVEDKASYGDDSYPALVGKQGTNAPCGYTSTSGIWQTVYLEGRSDTYLDYAHANPDIDNEQVTFDLKVQSDLDKTVTVAYNFQSVIWDDKAGEDGKGEFKKNDSSFSGEQKITLKTGQNFIKLDPAKITNQKLWNFDSPNLYQGTIQLKDGDSTLDEVSTYFGQRKISKAKYGSNNYEYLYINNKPVFLSGLLDQGFWKDGIYTAPSEAALKYDMKSMRDRGFNMIRKHLKIEDPLEYAWADRLGMFVWQDMPHATYMNPKSENDDAKGRSIYEAALEQMLDRNYNHPSVIAVMLFNETWGIQHSEGGWNNKFHASDGMTTDEWIKYLYNKTKKLNPNLLVEDMSACNNDHMQPTDLNTFHMYPGNYSEAKNTVDDRNKNTYSGSKNNFLPSYKQDGDPWLNSEYGGVGAYAGDSDVSWCFKYQTDIQRQYQKLNGFVYTEPYDVEYERNGLLTYDRRAKEFGYGDIAYGGDMRVNFLTQPNYVGIDFNPAPKMLPGTLYEAPAVALNWSGETYTDAVLKWRFDATDVYGNSIATGISGQQKIDYKPYTREDHTISFKLPSQKTVGTVTLWIEANGKTIAKNFANVVVAGSTNTPAVDTIGKNSMVLRQNGAAPTKNDFANLASSAQPGAGEITYTYQVPSSFDFNSLSNMRIIAEVSSIKNQTVNKGITNSINSQTTVGSERPSDMSVSVNGVEVDTVNIPDNPRDIRGTLNLPNSGASGGNYGYLVNLRIPEEKVDAVKAAIKGNNNQIVVSYKVKDDAVNKNGLRIYTENNGRYAVNPMVILNPNDIKTETAYATASNNYSVEATVSGNGEGFKVRYDASKNTGYSVTVNGGEVVLAKCNGTELAKATAGTGSHLVKVTLFDDHIKVFEDNNPVPVIDTYDFSSYIGGVAPDSGISAVVIPETYFLGNSVEEPQVQYVDTFNRASGSDADPQNNTFGSRYKVVGANVWNGSNAQNNLQLTTANCLGNKLVINNTESSDVIVEGDITLGDGNTTNDNGNLGFVIRGNDFTDGIDGANGYYVGLGINGTTSGLSGSDITKNGEGFIQVGRMNQGWTQLAKVPVSVKKGETHRLKIVAVGSRIRVYLDNDAAPKADVYDATYSSGSVALRSFATKGSYDEIVVSTAPRYDTDFSNGKLNEWAGADNCTIHGGVLNAAAGTVALVGNSGWSDYEYSADVKLTSVDAKAGVALRATNQKGKDSGYYVLADAASNQLQLVKSVMGVSSLLAKETFYAPKNGFNVKVRAVNNGIRVYINDSTQPVFTAYDNTYLKGQAGVIVKSGSAAFDNVKIKDKFVYQEDFADGTLDGWNIIDGNFSVKDNEMHLEDGAGKKMVDGYATWGDYVIKAQVKLDTRTDVKSNAGYIFRCSDFGTGQDDLRGYVLGINYNANQGSAADSSGIELGDLHYGWRSVKNDHSFVIDPNKWYDFEVRAVGNKIAVLIDGKQYYEIEDNAYRYGMFGLRNFNAGLHVKKLVVTPVGESTPDGKVHNIISVSQLTDISVPYGTTYNKLGLPSSVTAVLDDKDATKISIPVVWSGEGYQANVPGTYTLTGELTLPDGVTNTKGLKVTAKAVVLEKTPVPSSITKVTVSPAAVSVQCGGTAQFSAVVDGTNSPSQSVIWTVTGNSSATTIKFGLLTVGADETAAILTVKATSTVDAGKSGFATVTVGKSSNPGNSSKSSGRSSSDSKEKTPAPTSVTKVDPVGNTAVITTQPGSIAMNGNTAEIETTVTTVTTDTTGTNTSLDTGKKSAVKIDLPKDAVVQQFAAKKDVDLTIAVPSEVAKDTNSNVALNIGVSKEILAAAKENQTDLTIKVKNTDTQQLAYSWTFRGEDLAKSAVPVTDVNIAMSVQLTTEVSEVNAITSANKGLVLSFDHIGVLPSVASVKISALEKGFKPGQTLYFYYYNPTTKQIESLSKDAYTVDADGYVTVQIYHCSDYVLLPKAVRSLTLDTKTYTMAPKTSYEIGVKLTNASDTVIKAYSSTKGVANVTILKNGNVKVTGAKTGLTYIMIDVYDKKNKILTHASVRVTVQNGVKPNGNSARQIGIF